MRTSSLILQTLLSMITMLTHKNLNLMKNKLRYRLSIGVVVASVIVFAGASCEKDDVFSGSPVGSDLNFITLRGTITTDEDQVVAGQAFPVTISLGDNPDTPEADLLTFPVDVNVEAIALIPNLNKRTRKSFVIPAGENSIESTINAPAGDATTTLPFSFDLKVFLSAITTGQDVAVRGFNGKQYSMVSDTLSLGYGDTSLAGTNSKRCSIRFDFEGPYSGSSSGGFNNLDLVFKKNGSAFRVSSASNNTRPVHGTTTNNTRYETINFYDDVQEYKVFNASRADSIAGIYTIKSPSGTGSNDRPHGFKVGDEVKLVTINGSVSNALVATVAAVSDAYTCTFNFTGTHLFSGQGPSFYQPVIVPRVNNDATNTPQVWSPFLAYTANESVVINSITYYAKKNVAANPAGNLLPASDPDNWTSVKPRIDWTVAFANPITWTGGSSTSPQTYLVNDIRVHNGVFYVCTKQHTLTSGSPTPNNDANRWTTAIVEYKSDVLHYTANDTFTIETFAKNLRVSPSDLRYKFAVRFPDGTSKVYAGTYDNLTVQPAANAVLKLTIQRTISEGASTYVITHTE